MKHLKEFTTTAQYNAYTADTANFILPNVSICDDNPTGVYYNPYDPYNGHEFVEIGGIKWATMNVGANSVTDYGLYFQWADTQGYTSGQCGSGSSQKYFGWSDTKYWTADTGSGSSGFTKYNSTDGKTVLEASDDAAVANWGGDWRMPTTEEFQALGAATTSAWTTSYNNSGVPGSVLTDKTDSSKTLFFPAAGNCVNGNLGEGGSAGHYWSSSLVSSNMIRACSVDFSSHGVLWLAYAPRYLGRSVRPVLGL